MTEARPTVEVPLTRVQILADVIFAGSMTIMVLGIDIPDPSSVTSDGELAAFLGDQARAFGVYAITFILIAVYWLKHLEHFSYLRRTDFKYLWLQLFYLMFLVALPFTSHFPMLFPGSVAAHVFYSSNIFCMGVFSYFSWRYATNQRRLVDSTLDAGLVRNVGHEAMMEPAIAIAAIGAAFVSTVAAEALFLVIPLAFAYQKRRRRAHVGRPAD